MNSFKKRLFTNLIIFGSSVLVFTIVILILNSDINKTIKEVNEMQTQIHQRNQTIELLTRSTDEMQEINKSIQVLEKILPTQDDLLDFRRNLFQLAQKYNLTFGLEYPAKDKTKSGAEVIIFDIALSGQFENIIAFLEDLELHHYIISINDFTLTKKTSGDFSFSGGGTVYIVSSENS